MAGSFCNYYENGILNLYFGATAFASAGTHYFGLCTGVDDTGAITGEPASGSYARKSMTNNKTTWSTASTGSLSNAVAVTFVTATGSWGTMTKCFISDSLTGDTNTLVWADLTAQKTIDSGDTAQFAASAFVISLD